MCDVIHVDFGQAAARESDRLSAIYDRRNTIGDPALGSPEEWAFTALSFMKVRYCEADEMMVVPKAAFSSLAVFFEEMAGRLGIIQSDTSGGAA